MNEAKIDANIRKQMVNQLVERFDSRMRSEFGGRLFDAGWSLLLGRYYGESRIVYFSVNPGVPRSQQAVDLASRDDWNVPFLNPPELRREYVYLANCQRFFESDAALNRCIQDHITSAFLVPWRTRNVGELTRLNTMTNGRLWEYSRQIATTILKDHRAQMVLAVGKAALRLLVETGVVQRAVQQTASLGPGGTYQWSRWKAEANLGQLTILQIPHFSRANSAARLKALAPWLLDQLSGFNLADPERAPAVPSES